MRCYRQNVLKDENYPNIVAKSNQHKFVQSTKCNRNDSLEAQFTHCYSLQTHAAVFLASSLLTLTLFITVQRLTSALALCPQLEPSRAQANPQTFSQTSCTVSSAIHTQCWASKFLPWLLEGLVHSNTQFICPKLVWTLTYYGLEACCHTSKM